MKNSVLSFKKPVMIWKHPEEKSTMEMQSAQLAHALRTSSTVRCLNPSGPSDKKSATMAFLDRGCDAPIMPNIWILLETTPACSWTLTPDQGAESNVVVPLDKLTGSDKP